MEGNVFRGNQIIVNGEVLPIITDGPTIPISAVEAQFGFLEGKILTIADASYSDREQRKAVKDLVKRAFRDQRNHLTGNRSQGSTEAA